MCQSYHRLFYCETFKSLPVQDRIGVVKRHNLCEKCLLRNHNVDSCFKTSICGVPGCGKNHTKFLHVESVQGNNRVSTVINNSVNIKSSYVLMPIVPIIINGAYETYALLDTGSNSSFCTNRLVSNLPDSITTSGLRRIPLAEHRQGCTLFTTFIHPMTIVVYWCAISWS